MPRTINEFISSMSKAEGFARLAQFEVEISLPPWVGDQGPWHPGSGTASTSPSQHISLLCNSISLPGHDLQTQSRQYGSEPARDVVQSHAFAGTVDATFYLSTKHTERDNILEWLHMAVNPHTHKANYYDNYANQSMFIYQLSSAPATRTVTFDERSSNILQGGGREAQINPNQVVAEQKLQVPKRVWGVEVTEVYPATVGGLEYDYKSKDSIATFDVKFNFKEWHTVSDDKLRTSDKEQIERMYTQKSYAPTNWKNNP